MPGLVCVLPTTGHVAALVRASTADWPTPVHVVETDDEKFASFDAADAALAASGTVTSELALAKTPMVVGYRVGWLTYLLARPLMHATYVVLINIVLGGPARVKQWRDLEDAVRIFGQDQEPPSLRAARAVLELAQSTPARTPGT